MAARSSTTRTTLTWAPTAAHYRAVVLGVCGVGAAVLIRRPDLLVLATPFAIVATWSWLRRPRRPVTAAVRLGNRTLREGEATRVTVTVAAADVPLATGSAGPASDGQVAVAVAPGLFYQLDPPLGVASAPLRGGEPVELPVTVRPTRWGVPTVGPVVLSVVDSWGAYRAGPGQVAADTDLRLTILPMPVTFDPTSSPPQPEGLVGPSRAARPGNGTEFSSLRTFVPGDRLRRIHWPSSLRTGVLHVSSTYADEDSAVVLVVDAFSDLGPREGIDGRPTSLDLTVRAASAMAEHHLGAGDRVGLRVAGAADVPEVGIGSGRRHLRRVLEALTVIRPATERREDATRSVAGIVPGSLVIVLSPLVDPAMVELVSTLGSRGLTTVVVDTMPEHLWGERDDVYGSLAWRLRRQTRRVDVERLVSAGIPVVPWRGPGSLDQVLRDISRRARAPRLVRR